MIVNTQDYSLCNRNNLYRVSFGCYDVMSGLLDTFM